MPTTSKRIQVQLRSEVLKTVEQLSEDKGLSLSKVVSLLLEEALAHRGMYGDGAQNGPQSNTSPTGSADFDALLQEHGSASYKNSRGRTITATKVELPESEDLSTDLSDAEMLRKIKVLKAAGVL